MPTSADDIWELLERAEQEAKALPEIAHDPITAELLRIAAPSDYEAFTNYAAAIAAGSGTVSDDEDAEQPDPVAALQDDAQRAALFAAAPEVADDLERLWTRASAFPSSSGSNWQWTLAPPFHDPGGSGRLGDVANSLVFPLLRSGRQYRRDLGWLLRWADQLHHSTAIGTAVALAIDDGDTTLAELIDGLIDGTADGQWSTAIPAALLRQQDPAAWAKAHTLLRSAGGQEGYRQSILATAGEAGLGAFLSTFDVAVDEELYRFSSFAAVATHWFGRELKVSDRAANGDYLRAAQALLQSAELRAQTLAGEHSGSAPPLQLALWAEAVHDTGSSIEQARRLRATDPDVERRAIAVFHLDRCLPRPAARAALVEALGDADLSIAAFALQRAGHTADDLLPGTAEGAVALLDRLPAKSAKLPAVAQLPEVSASRSDAARVLLLVEDTEHLALLAERVDEFDPTTRYLLIDHHGKRLAAEHRAVLLRLVGDASSWVRDSAFEVAKDLALTDEEADVLEPLLRRKAGDLRHQVLSLLAARGPAAATASVARLQASGNAQQRAAADDLLTRIDTGAGAAVEPTEDDGFGLVDATQLTEPVAPVDRGTPIAGEDVHAVLTALDAFVHEQRATEIALEATNEHYDFGMVCVADLSDHHLRNAKLPADFDALRRRSIDGILAQHAGNADQAVLLARAVRTAAATHTGMWMFGERDAASERALAGMPELELRHGSAVHALLTDLDGERRTAAVIDWALDAMEALLATPAAGAKHRWDREALIGQPLAEPTDWFVAAPDAFSDDQARRLWGLTRWVMDVAHPISLADLDEWHTSGERHSSRIPRRPSTMLVTTLHDRGLATDADLLDDLVGPRSLHINWRSLSELTAPPGEETWQLSGSEAVRAIANQARARVVEVELARGEGPTAATPASMALSESGGMDVLLGALQALGKDRLHRGWAGGAETRSASFSSLIRTSVPGPDDTPQAFAAQVAETDVARTRLVEVACYAPQWAAHVESALARPGLEDAVWWVHAHTKDSQWEVGAALRGRWRREVAARCELSDEDLTDGAVDVEWFARVRAAVGAAGSAEVLGAARFASSSGGHKRAELFALALESKVPLKELRTRITQRRHQDAVRALGLRPLSAKRAEADLRERYEVIQRFIREAKQFGSQRQESERRAAAIGLDNLARTAGYRDPIRLGWAMEAASTADLAAGVEVIRGDVTIRLGVDEAGRAEVGVRRGDRPLKAIPAALRKDQAVAAIQSRKTELRRIQSRVRDGLEAAMVRGDAIDSAELLALRDHVVLWPQLRRLVLAAEQVPGTVDALGFAADDPAELMGLGGALHPVAEGSTLRVAHPVDLLASGDWPAWQSHVLREELSQPFKQVFRELYLPIDAETDEEHVGASRRYAGHQVRPAQAQRLLTGRGWSVESWMPPTRTLRQEGLVVEVDLELGWGTAAEVEPPAVDVVRFRRLADHHPVALADVPARVFSEIMRDLDLVVSVAHASGVDPEPSTSTIEMRAALVRETAALLGLTGVRVEERRALIDGSLGSYAVHLGSGQVSRLPGGSVCIIPVQSQYRGRVFLPFADDDPRSAEVLSKVLLLARDEEIRDPEILAQLR